MSFRKLTEMSLDKSSIGSFFKKESLVADVPPSSNFMRIRSVRQKIFA